MNQFQIVSALMESARSAVTATLGERAEVVWPMLEGEARRAAEEAAGELAALLEAPAEVDAGAMLVAPPRTPNQIRLAEEASKYRKIERAALDYLDKRVEEGKVTPYFHLVLRDGILSYRSSINSDLVGLISKKEHGGAYKKLSKEAKQDLFRVANEAASILREGSDSLIEAQYASQNLGFAPGENPLKVAEIAENRYRYKIAEYVGSQIGPETAKLLTLRPEIAGSISLGEVKDARGLASRVAELASKYTIRVNELANQAAARMAGEKDPARVADAYQLHGVTPREMFDQERIFGEFDGAARELESRGVPVRHWFGITSTTFDFGEYRAAIARLKEEIAKAEETHAKARSERAKKEERAKAAERVAEKAAEEARPTFSGPQVKALHEAKRKARLPSSSAFRPLEAGLAKHPNDAKLREQMTLKDEDEVRKRAARFLSDPKYAIDLTRTVHVDGSYAYATDGRALARFVTKRTQPEPLPHAIRPDMMKSISGGEKSGVYLVDGRSLLALARVRVAARGKSEEIPAIQFRLEEGEMSAEFEPTWSRLLPTKFEETVSLVPVVKSERIIDEIGPENRIAFDAEQIEKSLVGVKGAVTIAFPRSNDAPIVLYREDGEAHLVMPIRTGTVPAKPAKRKR